MNDASQKQPPILRTEHVCRSYPDGRVDAVVDVSLEIAEREYVAIMGPSGSGKSTLLNLLGSLDRPTAGRVDFRGEPLDNVRDLDSFRACHLGFVFQSFCLLPMLTALENVQVPMFEMGWSSWQRRERAETLLTAVDLGHRLRHVPAKLSVGERQRVAIARALANDPALVMADEPTGNLDSLRSQEVLDLFDKLRAERSLTLIVVTHSAEVAQRADRILHLRDGKLVNDALKLRLVA